MFSEFKPGDTVKVWPLPGLRVQSHAETPGRFLSPDGEEVTWSDWHHNLARQGSILLTDPHVSYEPATHAMHPHEWVAEHGKPAMHLTDEELKKLDRAVLWHLVEGSKEARAQHLAAKKTPPKSEPAKPTSVGDAATKEGV